MTEVEKAYLAGLVDGEGCISITSSSTPNKKSCSFSVSLSVSNTDIELLNHIVAITGIGKITLSSRSRKSRELFPQWKPVYLWRVFAVEMRLLLPIILPYLVGKRQRAQLVTEFFALTKGQGYGSHLSAPEKYVRDQILAELKELNRRGNASI